MNEQEKLALKKRFETMDSKAILCELAVLVHEARADGKRIHVFLFGNGKMGFVTKTILGFAALSVGVVLGLGERALAYIAAIRAVVP